MNKSSLPPDHRPGATPDRHGPLAGIRVVDLSRVLAGPYCTMLLGDMGADVVKVESPGRGDDSRHWGPPYAATESGYYLSVNRSKRGITVDLKDPRGVDVVRRLIDRADVLIENFKTGTLERLGLGYDELRRTNPGLVACAISGFGRTGPYADRPGYDFVVQAMGGIMSMTGEAGGEPMKVGVAWVDVMTGLMACAGILGALHHRERTGEGQLVEVSLLETAVSALINAAQYYLISGEEPPRAGNSHGVVVPYQAFRASDKPFVVAAGNDGQFAALCRVIGRQDLMDDPRFATNSGRVIHRDDLLASLQETLSTRPAAEWVAALLAVGVPSGPIHGLGDVFSDPQVLHRGMLAEVDHPTIGRLKLPGVPFVFGETPAAIRRPPPLQGEHTDEVLGELGLSVEEIAALRADGTV